MWIWLESGVGRVERRGDVSQREQSFHYTMSTFYGYNVQHCDYSYSSVLLYTWKWPRVAWHEYLECAHHTHTSKKTTKKSWLCEVMGMLTQWGDRFTIYTYIKLSCCTL